MELYKQPEMVDLESKLGVIKEEVTSLSKMCSGADSNEIQLKEMLALLQGVESDICKETIITQR